MRLLSKISAACILLLGLCAYASGQEARSMRDFDFIRTSSPWLTSRNAAGLNTMPVEKASIAEGEFSRSNGGLKDDATSENSFKAGIQTESYLRISERMSFYGKLSYSYDRGQNMGGSILMDPSYNPLNFYESADTTGGTKNRELYNLEGGLSYILKDSRWSLGARIGYESGDQAKLKDPRFQNVWMDLEAGIGTRFAASETFSAGISLEYRRTLESLLGNTYGISGKQYYTFIDYGGFFGTRELFDGMNAMVPTSTTRPMFNNFMGASLQVETGRKIKVFNQLTYLMRSGYYGSKGSTSITYTEHGGNVIEYNGILLAGNGRNRHRIGLDLRFENLVNNENVYRLNTEVGEHTEVEYLSQNEVLDRSDISAVLTYKGFMGVENFRAKWEYGATAGFDSRQSLATIYPFYRSSSYGTLSTDLYGKRNIISGRNIFTIGLGFDFATGFGTPKNDGAYAGTSSDAPRSFDNYLYRDFEYRTATRAGGSFTFRYTRAFSDKTGAYVQLSDRYVGLLKDAEYLQNGHRNKLMITIGCAF